MTINEAIAKIQVMKPSPYDEALLIAWISELDGQLMDTVFRNRSNAPDNNTPYTGETDPTTVLCVPFPYDMIYLHWLSAKIDFANGETDRYSNSMAMYNAYHESFVSSWARGHASTGTNEITI